MGQAQGLPDPGSSAKSDKARTALPPADLDPGQGGTHGLGRGIDPPPPQFLPLAPSQAVYPSRQGPLPPGDFLGSDSRSFQR